MKKLQFIYFFTVFPFLFGSTIFFSWYFNRILYANDFSIEGSAFWAIILFILFSLITVIISIVGLFKKQLTLKKLIIPLLFIPITTSALICYGTIYSTFEDQVFVLFTQESKEVRLERIWSANFEQIYFDMDFETYVYSFTPVRNYDWENPSYHISDISFRNSFTYSEVYIDLRTKDDSVFTDTLPDFWEGSCLTVDLDKLLED